MAKIRKANRNSNMMVTRAMGGSSEEDEAMVFTGTWTFDADVDPSSAVCDFGAISNDIKAALSNGKNIVLLIPENETVETALSLQIGNAYSYPLLIQVTADYPALLTFDSTVDPIEDMFNSLLTIGDEGDLSGHYYFSVALK